MIRVCILIEMWSYQSWSCHTRTFVLTKKYSTTTVELSYSYSYSSTLFWTRTHEKVLDYQSYQSQIHHFISKPSYYYMVIPQSYSCSFTLPSFKSYFEAWVIILYTCTLYIVVQWRSLVQNCSSLNNKPIGSADRDRSVSVWFLVCKILFPYT